MNSHVISQPSTEAALKQYPTGVVIPAKRPTVRTDDRGTAFVGYRWLATCNVAGCPWSMTSDAKVVIKEYARHHRNGHQAAYFAQTNSDQATECVGAPDVNEEASS